MRTQKTQNNMHMCTNTFSRTAFRLSDMQLGSHAAYGASQQVFAYVLIIHSAF